MSAELFTCPRHAGGLRVTESGCAQMFRRARAGRYDDGDPIGLCRGCEIGARHAGVDVSPSPSAQQPRQLGARHCLRCERRAIRHAAGGRLCISCWNRGREYLVGIDARGNVPQNIPALHGYTLAVSDRQRVVVWSATLHEALEVLLSVSDTYTLSWPPINTPAFTEFDRSAGQRRPQQCKPSFSSIATER